MHKAEPNIAISILCRLLELPISYYYYTPMMHHEEEKIKAVMEEIHESNYQAYGKRQMLRALRNEKFNIVFFKISKLIKKLLFHSDQGVQYMAELFKETLLPHGITKV